MEFASINCTYLRKGMSLKRSATSRNEDFTAPPAAKAVMALARLRASGELIRPDQWEKVNQKQPWAPQTYIFRGKNVNNLAFRWPQPLSFMVLGVHGMHYCSFASTNLGKNHKSNWESSNSISDFLKKMSRMYLFWKSKAKGFGFTSPFGVKGEKKPKKMEAVFERPKISNFSWQHIGNSETFLWTSRE